MKLKKPTQTHVNLQDLAQVETTQWQIAEQSSKFIVINEQKEVPYQHEDTTGSVALPNQRRLVLFGLPWAILLTLGCNSRRTQASYIISAIPLWGPGCLKECQRAPDCCVWSTVLTPSLLGVPFNMCSLSLYFLVFHHTMENLNLLFLDWL